jgi:hypothetical protein
MPKVDRKKKGRRWDVLQHPALASGTSASLEEDQSERLELLEQVLYSEQCALEIRDENCSTSQ